MNKWTPGEGWRKTDDFARAEVVWYRNGQTQGGIAWVREKPVPSLPTEPYTVIRVDWHADYQDQWGTVLALGVGHDWAWSPVGKPGFIDVVDLPKMITGWKPISEPRAVTAKAIFSRMREYNGLVVGESDEFDSLEREFGVES